MTNKNRTALEQLKCCGRGNNWADNLLCRNHSQQSLYVAGIADQLPEWSIFFDTIGWSGHVTIAMRSDNWLGFKSLWLGLRIRAYGQGLGSSFEFSVSVFRVRVYPAVHLMQTRSCVNCLPALKPWQPLPMHGTELLQMSWSTKQDMRSKLVMWLLQPTVFS